VDRTHVAFDAERDTLALTLRRPRSEGGERFSQPERANFDKHSTECSNEQPALDICMLLPSRELSLPH